MKIDVDFQDYIIPLAEEGKSQLENNLLKDGCRDPLVVWNGILIDGHNRYEICTRLNTPFQTTSRDTLKYKEKSNFDDSSRFVGFDIRSFHPQILIASNIEIKFQRQNHE